jgi:hypothetical protein
MDKHPLRLAILGCEDKCKCCFINETFPGMTFFGICFDVECQENDGFGSTGSDILQVVL